MSDLSTVQVWMLLNAARTAMGATVMTSSDLQDVTHLFSNRFVQPDTIRTDAMCWVNFSTVVWKYGCSCYQLCRHSRVLETLHHTSSACACRLTHSPSLLLVHPKHAAARHPWCACHANWPRAVLPGVVPVGGHPLPKQLLCMLPCKSQQALRWRRI